MKVKSLLLIFIFLLSFVYLFLEYEKQGKIDQYLDEKTKQYLQNYTVLYDYHKKLSELIFKTKINTTNVQKIYSKTLYASNAKEKHLIRNELYNSLKDTYVLLQEYNIRQLHFHLPNNESFLRFHKPEKFGDNLTTVRATVKYVNENKKPIDGFEEGRIYNGYRYVFPLFYEGNHLGSVEISFSSLAMNIELMENFNLVGKFLILKSIVGEKVFESEKNNYVPSQFKNYLYEKKILESLKKYNKDDLDLVVSKKTEEIIQSEINNTRSFSLYDETSDTIMTFLKVQNPISKQTVGMYVLRSDSMVIHSQNSYYRRMELGSTLFLIVLFIFIYRALNEKELLARSVKRKTKKLIESQYKMKNYIELVDDNIIISSTDLKGKITYASKAFCKTSGYTKEELLGANHNIIKHPDMPVSLFKEFWETIESNNIWEGDIKNRKKDGGYYWVHAKVSPIFDTKGFKTGYTAIRQDITARKTIEEISVTDGLTGIYNRRHFNEIFPKVINSSKRNNDLIAFLIMDVDHFKQYNDTYGHVMGDEALIKIAQSIQNTLKRADDYCFRLGGEEFAVIYKVERSEQALTFAHTIKDNIEQLKIEHKYNSASPYVTASMGLVCSYAQDIPNDDVMYSEADHLLYDAKKSQRNTIVVNEK